jgi:hypothetical protein
MAGWSRSQKVAHWLGLGAVGVAAYFEAKDVMMLRLWEASWPILLFTAVYVVVLALALYWGVRGLGWAARRLGNR